MIGISLRKNWEHKMDLNELSKIAFNISEERQKHGAFGKRENSVQNLLKYCAGEVVEAMEAYKDYNDIESAQDKKGFADELADIICCCLIIAGKENIDIEKAILDCIEKNRKRAEGVGDKL